MPSFAPRRYRTCRRGRFEHGFPQLRSLACVLGGPVAPARAILRRMGGLHRSPVSVATDKLGVDPVPGGPLLDDTFDVFLSHNSKDKPAVRQIAEALEARGLRVWLDEKELPPGVPWQDELEKIIETVPSAAVMIGKEGLGPWETSEMRACLSEMVDRKLRVIPVMLPEASPAIKLPILLRQSTWLTSEAGSQRWGPLVRRRCRQSGQADVRFRTPGQGRAIEWAVAEPQAAPAVLCKSGFLHVLEGLTGSSAAGRRRVFTWGPVRPTLGPVWPIWGTVRPSLGADAPTLGSVRPLRDLVSPPFGPASPSLGPAGPSLGTARPLRDLVSPPLGTGRPKRGPDRPKRGADRPR